jgi:hypothetical protein
VKLLLDELYAKQIAEQLRERGHDVVSAKERPDLEGLKDEELFLLMPTEQRGILTENWADYDRLIRMAADAGTTHYGVLFTSRRQLPRSRDTIGLYVRVLDEFLQRHAAVDATLNGSRWLPEQPP